MQNNAQLSTPYPISVDERLIPEIPRMFSSFQDILREIAQNSGRVGATRVMIEYEPGQHVLTWSDNGPGLAEPATLLTAGATSWGDDVVEPAGLGAFSLLAGEFVEHVTYYSRTRDTAWRMRLSPENLTTLEAKTVDLPPDGTTGLKIVMKLNRSVFVKREAFKEARSLYPYSVYLRADPESEFEEIEPDRGFEADIDIQTAVGRVRWALGWTYSQCKEVVWEHRRINSTAFADGLKAAAGALDFPQMAMRVAQGHIQWFPENDTSVRPRLPDRSEMIADQALSDAADVILKALCEHILQKIRLAAANWPDRFSISYSTKLPGTKDIAWVNNEQFLSSVLPQLGWPYVHDLDPRTFITYEGDGLEGETDHISFFDRNAIVVHDTILAFSIFNQMREKAPDEDDELRRLDKIMEPQAVVWDPEAEACDVRIENPRYDAASSPDVALCDSIHVEGIGPLPYLITTDRTKSFQSLGLELGEAVILFAGNTEDFLAAMAKDDIFAHLAAYSLFETGELYDEDWIDYDDEWHLDINQIIEDLALQVTATFQPEMIDRRQTYFTWKRRHAAIVSNTQRLREILYSAEFRLDKLGDLAWSWGFQALELLMHGVSRASGCRLRLLKHKARLQGNR